jgi:hypothetical protein
MNNFVQLITKELIMGMFSSISTTVITVANTATAVFKSVNTSAEALQIQAERLRYLSAESLDKDFPPLRRKELDILIEDILNK